MSKKIKICVVTGSRADYGMLFWLIKDMQKIKKIDLKLLVTGMHLSKEFGNTINVIKRDGFKIDSIIDINNKSIDEMNIGESIGIGIKKFTTIFTKIKPKVLILLGDRFETFSAAVAANISRIPIAHIHGGETTRGAFDEGFRHSITKMSHLHFTSTQIYKKRVIQLGELPSRVFCVGALGLETIRRSTFLSKKMISKKFSFKFAKKNILITYHPVTLENKTAKNHFDNLIKAIDKLQDTHFIFTKSNSDIGGKIINGLIDNYVAINSDKAWAYESLGQLNYLSVLNFMDGVVGNSSSGLIEAPSLKIGTINIGDRQAGRELSKSVINCSNDSFDISLAFKKLFSKKFTQSLSSVKNLHGKGEVSNKIITKILKTNYDGIIKKVFYDIK